MKSVFHPLVEDLNASGFPHIADWTEEFVRINRFVPRLERLLAVQRAHRRGYDMPVPVIAGGMSGGVEQ